MSRVTSNIYSTGRLVIYLLDLKTDSVCCTACIQVFKWAWRQCHFNEMCDGYKSEHRNAICLQNIMTVNIDIAAVTLMKT